MVLNRDRKFERHLLTKEFVKGFRKIIIESEADSDGKEFKLDSDKFDACHKSFCDLRRRKDQSTVCLQAWQPFLSQGATDIEMHYSQILVIDDFNNNSDLEGWLKCQREATANH